MKYTMTTPCNECPFLLKMKQGFTLRRLQDLSEGSFHCHQTGEVDEVTSNFVPNENSVACAGALIFREKRNAPSQIMRIAERVGLYDRTKLDMKAKVR